MKNVLSAAFLSLFSLPVLSATQEATTETPLIEPLGTGYLVILGVVAVAVFFGLWKYYMQWDDEEDKSDRK